ncbi:MAG: CHASE2 domain-containing protein [Kiloniellales bacterium]
MSRREQSNPDSGEGASLARVIRHRRRLVLFCIAFAVNGGVLLATENLAFLTAIENRLVDLRIAYFTPPEDQSPDIAVITVNEQTLADPSADLACRQPLDRDYLARLVEALHDLPVRAIGLDYLFDRPTDPEKDRRLKRAIAASKVPVVIGWAAETSELLPEQRRHIESFKVESGAIPGNVQLGIQEGITRRLFIRPGGPQDPPAFPVAIAEAIDRPVPAGDLERAYRGRPSDGSDQFATVPVQHVLKTIETRPAFLQRLLGDKIVLVGADLPEDHHATPLGDNVPGVIIHAHALGQVLEGRQLPRSGPVLDALLALVMAVVATVLVLLDRPQLIKLGLAAVAAAAFWAGGFLWYYLGGPMIPLLAPALGLGTAYGVGSAFIGRHEQRLKEQIRKAFAQFLAPELVEELAAHPERLKLGGETRDMTVMFMDIRGFTTLSETMNPQQLTSFINDFLTPMSEIILECRGTIDKYIGDCIMALWNAPLDDPEHVPNACRAALGMRDAVARLYRDPAQSALPHPPGDVPPQIAIGIGLNTGECNVGNMGSKQRFAYSAMGDEVNLASRLEGQCKTYGVDIVIGERTAEAAAGLATLELDLIRVKGKATPVRIHTLLGDERLGGEAAFAALAQGHQSMLAAYRAQDWDAADAALDRCRGLALDAGVDLRSLYELYAGRIADYRADPPPGDWDGVFVATTK